MKQIIVGVDDIASAEHVTECAASFARDLDAHLLVVHVVPRAVVWMIAGVQIDYAEYRNDLRGLFERELMTSLRGRGIAADLYVDYGDPAHELAMLAEHGAATLIVIGGTDHRRLHALTFGSVAARLQHLTSVPIVVVPRAAARPQLRAVRLAAGDG
jgi:nucleotide-binding universal stress UspA family protein